MNIQLFNTIRQDISDVISNGMQNNIHNSFEDDIFELSNDTQILALNDILTSDVAHYIENKINEQIKISNVAVTIQDKEDRKYLFIRYIDTINRKCKLCLNVKADKESLITAIAQLTEFIILGQSKVNNLNNMLESIRIDKGSLFSIKFMVGNGTSSSVNYWDYNLVIIKLSEKSVNTLIEAEDIDISLIEWPDNIINAICNYNELQLSKDIQSKLCNDTVESIVSIFTKNMLNTNDVRNMINKDIDQGIQKLKSVEVISSDLGIFVALLVWNIDYRLREASIEILDSKVMDIENKRFVTDKALYDRIETRMLRDGENICLDFKNRAS